MIFSVDKEEPCSTDGLATDPNDCHAYTRCFKGRLYRLSCGPNAAFDVATGACLSGTLVDGCEPSGFRASTNSACLICQHTIQLFIS